LCEWLVDRGAIVRVHDPVVKSVPSERFSRVEWVERAPAAAEGASALVVATAWPEYREVPACDVARRMARRLVLDAGGFTRDTLGADASIEYFSVGKAGA
jgi:UDPglucose 6-dehydrogenase